MRKLFTFKSRDSLETFNSFWEENIPSRFIKLKGNTLFYDNKRLTEKETLIILKQFTITMLGIIYGLN